MPDANFSSRETLESFTSALQVQKKVSQIDADVGIVLVEPEFLANLVADDIVALLLDVLADIFALQAEGIKAAVADFPVGKTFVLQVCRKLGMAFIEDHLCGAEKGFPVCHQDIDFFFRRV